VNVRSCWLNGLYTRVVPSHAVELTSTLLDRGVASTLERRRIATATLHQKQDLAAVIHLCGAGPGDAYAKRGFRLTARQRCGDYDVRGGYLPQVNAMKRVFARLATVALSPSSARRRVQALAKRWLRTRRRTPLSKLEVFHADGHAVLRVPCLGAGKLVYSRASGVAALAT
jgi:hypothetical protein